MASFASAKYQKLVERAAHFHDAASDKRIRPLSKTNKENYYHAALAAYVAAWEAYLEELVRNFYTATAKPSHIDYNATHTIARSFSVYKIEKFNTPNFENSRNLLIECTGYDPYPYWIWPKKSMNVTQVKQLLNEILKVRHSFAHGYAIPQYTWNTLSNGDCNLTKKSLDMVCSFFNNLVKQSDSGMQNYIKITYGVNLPK